MGAENERLVQLGGENNREIQSLREEVGVLRGQKEEIEKKLQKLADANKMYRGEELGGLEGLGEEGLEGITQ